VSVLRLKPGHVPLLRQQPRRSVLKRLPAERLRLRLLPVRTHAVLPRLRLVRRRRRLKRVLRQKQHARHVLRLLPKQPSAAVVLSS
jgi:hypothetical protein